MCPQTSYTIYRVLSFSLKPRYIYLSINKTYFCMYIIGRVCIVVTQESCKIEGVSACTCYRMPICYNCMSIYWIMYV